MALPVEVRRTIVGEQLARILLVDRLGELPGFGEVRLRGLEPQHVGVRRVGAGARDRRLDAVLNDEETSGERSPVHQRRSYSSMSLVNRPALFASVRAMRIVLTSH